MGLLDLDIKRLNNLIDLVYKYLDLIIIFIF